MRGDVILSQPFQAFWSVPTSFAAMPVCFTVKPIGFGQKKFTFGRFQLDLSKSKLDLAKSMLTLGKSKLDLTDSNWIWAKANWIWRIPIRFERKQIGIGRFQLDFNFFHNILNDSVGISLGIICNVLVNKPQILTGWH